LRDHMLNSFLKGASLSHTVGKRFTAHNEPIYQLFSFMSIAVIHNPNILARIGHITYNVKSNLLHVI
jgi:hypothetical protein